MITTELNIPDNVQCGDKMLVHIAPFGDFAQYNAKGDKVIQHINDVTINKLIQSFEKPVLVDVDHKSTEHRGETKAYAWITGLEKTDDGLRGTMQFTECGAEAVANGEYRFLSPVWRVDKDGNPFELISVALTNTPNLPLNSIGNSKIEEPVEPTNNKESKMTKIINALGLAEDADEDAIVNAIGALKERISKHEADKKNAEAEDFAAKNCGKVKDKEALKNAYLENPELTMAILGNCKEDEPKSEPTKAKDVAKPIADKVCNSKDAKEPEDALSVSLEVKGNTPEERCEYMLKNASLFNKTIKED